MLRMTFKKNTTKSYTFPYTLHCAHGSILHHLALHFIEVKLCSFRCANIAHTLYTIRTYCTNDKHSKLKSYQHINMSTFLPCITVTRSKPYIRTKHGAKRQVSHCHLAFFWSAVPWNSLRPVICSTVPTCGGLLPPSKMTWSIIVSSYSQTTTTTTWDGSTGIT